MTIEAIWREYQAAIRRFLLSRVANVADVDDLQQEILLKTHLNLHTLESQTRIKAWLFQIANRVIIDFYRQKAKSKDLSVEDLWYEQQSTDIKQELLGCIAPFIQALPEPSAELLSEIELHNRSQKEYAAEQGISYSTLKSRVQKSRQQLREVFEDCCHLSLDAQGNLIDYQQKGKDCHGCKPTSRS